MVTAIVFLAPETQAGGRLRRGGCSGADRAFMLETLFCTWEEYMEGFRVLGCCRDARWGWGAGGEVGYAGWLAGWLLDLGRGGGCGERLGWGKEDGVKVLRC